MGGAVVYKPRARLTHGGYTLTSTGKLGLRPGKMGLYDPEFEHDSCGVGFIAHIKGKASHDIVINALTMLEHMEHRGACGCEENTGDGAGILTAMPHKFLAKIASRDAGIKLPDPGKYGAGIVFLPSDNEQRKWCEKQLEQCIKECKLKLLGWRDVPVDNHGIGPSARRTEPKMRMIFVTAADGDSKVSQDELERKLYVARKSAGNQIRSSDLPQAEYFYVCSLSTKTIIYKGQLTSPQVREYFAADLGDADYVSHIALVHSRFSTNTFPSWDRAQPLRFMAHNGEINTRRGNVNWMHAREGMFQSRIFGQDIDRIKPVIEPGNSDSGDFDNCLEMLLQTGRSLPHAVMMMIPEAWQNHESMDPRRRAFYEFHSCMMEPWDGPASVAFTDGHYIGAVLDRNGLRPSRYYVTKDDLVIMASEVGVLEIDPANVAKKGRLQPGRMFLVDFEQGRIIDDSELKAALAAEHPYGQWLQEQKLTLEDLPKPKNVAEFDAETLLTRAQCLGYTTEDVYKLILPMGAAGLEALGSMGNDAALACLSDQPRLVYDYFKQTFAQVTNPPLDSDKESIVMSLECYIGPERNLLEPTAENAHRLLVSQPILTNCQLAQMKELNHRGWKSRVIDMTFDRRAGEQAGLRRLTGSALKRIRRLPTDAASLCSVIGNWVRTASPFRRCLPAEPSTIISSAAKRERVWAWCWKPVKPAKCIITACSSATGPTPSTLIWRLKYYGICGGREISTRRWMMKKSLKITSRRAVKAS